MAGEKCGLTVLAFFVNAQSIMHIVLQLHDVLRFYSTVVINTFAAGLIQAVRKKQLFRTWLCG